MLSSGRSQRTASLKETITFGEEWAKLEAALVFDKAASVIDMTIGTSAARPLRVNGAPFDRKKRKTPLPAVIFTPDDLRIVKGSPDRRRSLLDSMLAQLKPIYGYNHTLYYKILRERNAALQGVASGKMSTDIIELFDEQLIETGGALISDRNDLVKEFSQTAGEHHKLLAEDGLALGYITQIDPEGDIPAAFRSRLKERRQAELARGATLVGPHRDDVLITMKGRDMRAFSSQGEQRTACLAIKLAEIDLLKREFHVKPVVLLDDVMSELDESRRRSLMGALDDGGQILITSTNREYFLEEELSRMKVIDLG